MITAIVVVFLVLCVGVLDALPGTADFIRATTHEERGALRFDAVTKVVCLVALVVAIYALATYEVGR